jgi:hypothetical protein
MACGLLLGLCTGHQQVHQHHILVLPPTCWPHTLLMPFTALGSLDQHGWFSSRAAHMLDRRPQWGGSYSYSHSDWLSKTTEHCSVGPTRGPEAHKGPWKKPGTSSVKGAKHNSPQVFLTIPRFVRCVTERVTQKHPSGG